MSGRQTYLCDQLHECYHSLQELYNSNWKHKHPLNYFSTMEPSESFPRLRISKLEGRATSTRFKQGQFHRLHETLKTSETSIKAAIAADDFLLDAEVDIEYAMALSELHLHYSSIDLGDDLRNMRTIEREKDNVNRSKSLGIAYIVPWRRNTFYSIISPLCAAIAAGNCVIIEVIWDSEALVLLDEHLLLFLQTYRDFSFN